MFNNWRNVKNILWASEIDTLTMLNVLYKSIIGASVVLRLEFPIFAKHVAHSTDRSYFSFDPRILITLSFILRRRAFRSINDRAYFLLARNLRGPPISNRINFYHPLVWSFVNNQRDYRNRGPSAPSVSLCTIHIHRHGTHAVVSLTDAGRCID